MPKLRCTKCKGTKVQIAMWVRPNTQKILDDFGSFDQTDTKWCDDCEEHVLLEEFEPPRQTEEEKRAHLKELMEREAKLEDHPRVGWCGYHPRVGWCGYTVDYQQCGEYVYRTYSGETCRRGHQGETLEEDPYRD